MVLMVDTEERLASLGNFEKDWLDFIAISHSEIAIGFRNLKLKIFENKKLVVKGNVLHELEEKLWRRVRLTTNLFFNCLT